MNRFLERVSFVILVGLSLNSTSIVFAENTMEINETNSLFNGNVYRRVKSFDIAGIRLGMKKSDVEDKAKENGYIARDINKDVPKFFRYNYDLECRKNNILTYDSLDLCIGSFARRDNVEYVDKITYKNPATTEVIEVYFTSNFTDNLVYKIKYINDLNNLLGDSDNFKYQREENRRAFWYKLINKYGEPNLDQTTWIYDLEDENSVTLKASFDGLILEAKGMSIQDEDIVVKKAKEMFIPKEYTF